MNPFGEKLFQVRRRRRLLQKVIAATAGLDQSYLASLENGRRDPPRTEVLDRILDALVASPRERAEIKRAAALARLLTAIEVIGDDFVGADAVARFAAAIPIMNALEIEAIETLIAGYQRRESPHSMEVAM